MKSNTSLKHLLKRGIVALFIKVGAAGSQFLMFLVLAWGMSSEAYGLLGFGFSLASLLAVVGSFGQRMLAMRFLSIYNADGKLALATGLLHDGFLIITGGTIAVSLVIAGGLAAMNSDLSFAFLLLTGGLALTIAWAEYLAFVLRAHHSVTLALVPRDIIWRLLVILAALPAANGLTEQLGAGEATALLAGLLAAVVGVQIFIAPATRPHLLFTAPAQHDRSAWWQAAWGLWGVSFVQIAAPNLTIVILGLLLTPQETGPVFAALRVAMLLNLFLLAANMVASPAISRLYSEGKMDALQRTCTAIALLASGAAGLMYFGLVLYGRWVLELFGTGFDEGFGVLLIIAGAYVINTLTGPISALLELSGNERAAFRLLTIMNVLSMSAMVPMIWVLGSVGAALCLAFSIAGWNLLAVFFARRNIGLDPSVAGLLFSERQK